jgi:hypothetical protein
MSYDEMHDLIMRTLCRVEMGEGWDDSRFGWRHHADALMAELAALRADAAELLALADITVQVENRAQRVAEIRKRYGLDAMQATP